MPNDWNTVRYELDKSDNFEEIINSPWYSDAEYDRFSDAEYQRRHNLAREKMAELGFDALILTGSPNSTSMGGALVWASGLIDPRTMCQYMVLPRVGEPTLIYPHAGCHIEAQRRAVALRDVRGGQHGRFGKALAERLIELGLEAGRIGITAADRNGPEYMGVSTYLDLQQRLPRATFEFVPKLLHALTRLKGPEEIAAMQTAGRLSINALEAVQAAAQPGVREYALEAAATHAMLAGGGRVHIMMIGSTRMAEPYLVFPNPRPSRRALQMGDVILTELSTAFLGYTAKIGQPVTLGAPTPQYERFYQEVVLPGFLAIHDQLRPGKSLEDVQRAGRFFRAHGAQSRPILVHGLDMITANPFIETDHIKADPQDLVIVPGMTFSIEITPIDATGTFGMFLSRSYAITETGALDLTPYPLESMLRAG